MFSFCEKANNGLETKVWKNGWYCTIYLLLRGGFCDVAQKYDEISILPAPTPNSVDYIFQNSQIWPVFSILNWDLLLADAIYGNSSRTRVVVGSQSRVMVGGRCGVVGWRWKAGRVDTGWGGGGRWPGSCDWWEELPGCVGRRSCWDVWEGEVAGNGSRKRRWDYFMKFLNWLIMDLDIL